MMKTLTLLTACLLLYGTAQAQTESDPLQITSGGAVINAGDFGVAFTYAGTGFTGGVAMGFEDSGNPLGFATAPQFGFSEYLSAGRDDSDVSFLAITGSAAFTGPGTFDGTFNLLIETDAPTQQCPACVPIYTQGSGDITVTMVQGTPTPEGFPVYYATQEVFTFGSDPPTVQNNYASPTAVPEPGTFALFAFGGLLAIGRQRHKLKRGIPLH